MPRSKKSVDLTGFHSAARKAAEEGQTAKQFARSVGTLANNVKAMLYEAWVEHGLKPVEFRAPERRVRGRKEQPTNLSEVTLYTGRARTPYLTIKVPREIVASSKAEQGDVFQWRLNKRGDIVGTNLKKTATVSDEE